MGEVNNAKMLLSNAVHSLTLKVNLHCVTITTKMVIKELLH